MAKQKLSPDRLYAFLWQRGIVACFPLDFNLGTTLQTLPPFFAIETEGGLIIETEGGDPIEGSW